MNVKRKESEGRWRARCPPQKPRPSPATPPNSPETAAQFKRSHANFLLKDLTFAHSASRRLSRLKVTIRRRRAGRLIGSETQTVHRKARRAAPPAGTVRFVADESSFSDVISAQRRGRGDISLTMRGNDCSAGGPVPEAVPHVEPGQQKVQKAAPTIRPHLTGRHGNSDRFSFSRRRSRRCGAGARNRPGPGAWRRPRCC